MRRKLCVRNALKHRVQMSFRQKAMQCAIFICHNGISILFIYNIIIRLFIVHKSALTAVFLSPITKKMIPRKAFSCHVFKQK